MPKFEPDEAKIDRAFSSAKGAIDEHKIKLIMELFTSLQDNEMKRAVFYLLDKWAVKINFRTKNT